MISIIMRQTVVHMYNNVTVNRSKYPQYTIKGHKPVTLITRK